MRKFLSSSHGRLSCSECHSYIEEKGVKHPDPKLLSKSSTLLYDYKRCGKCHPQEYQRYLKGAHAKALVEKKKDVPTCGNCHVSHYAPFSRSRLELGKWMTEMCGTCHPVQKQTYLENYHGKTAATLGYEASAYCTDCHGAHTCLSLKKREAVLEACQKVPSKYKDSICGLFDSCLRRRVEEGGCGEAEEGEGDSMGGDWFRNPCLRGIGFLLLPHIGLDSQKGS